MEQYVKQVDDVLNNALNNFVRKPTLIRGIVHLLLILYAARIAPSLPKTVLVLFENAYFKLFIFSLILWTAQFSPSTSLLIALGFMITINYVNNKPVWEFLENVEAEKTAAPVAPNKAVAVEAAASVVQQQAKETPVVHGVSQREDTIVIQPTVVQTSQGPAVVNPSVVIAPAIVASASGEKVIVKPEVTMVEAPKPTAMPTLADAPAMAPAPAPAPTPATTAAKEPQAEPAPTPAAQAEGCYPLRRYDLSKVKAFDHGDGYGPKFNYYGDEYGSYAA
jgi:hypothetical protein